MPLRRVAQKTTTDCGVATIAMIAGVTYKRAMQTAHGRSGPGNAELTTKELIRALRSLDYKCRYTKKIKTSTCPVILLIFWHPEDDTGHYVIYDPWDKRVIDPAHKQPFDLDYYLERLHYAIAVTGRRKPRK